jgi:hypothetical protein
LLDRQVVVLVALLHGVGVPAQYDASDHEQPADEHEVELVMEPHVALVP